MEDILRRIERDIDFDDIYSLIKHLIEIQRRGQRLSRIISLHENEDLYYSLIEAGEPAVPLFANLLRNTDEKAEDRILAAAALGKIGDVEALPALETVLVSENNPKVVRYTIIAIGEIGHEDSVETIEDYISTGPESYTLLAAIYALGEIGSENSIYILDELAYSTRDSSIAREIASALSKINDPTSFVTMWHITLAHEGSFHKMRDLQKLTGLNASDFRTCESREEAAQRVAILKMKKKS